MRRVAGLLRREEPAAREHRDDLTDRIAAPVAGGHVRIAVLSLKGGVGTTTVTLGIGSVLAPLRDDRVIAVDANSVRGTLADRIRRQTSATIRDLVHEHARVDSYADARAFTSQAASRLEILASRCDPAVSVTLSADDYRAVAGVLKRYYAVCVTDCGTGLLHPAMAGILELADQVVLVTSPAIDGARSTSAAIDWLAAHGHADLVRGAIVAVSGVRAKGRPAIDLDRLEQHFAACCRAVVRIPHDPNLEAGTEFSLDQLAPGTADAYLTLTAAVADAFLRPAPGETSPPLS